MIAARALALFVLCAITLPARAAVTSLPSPAPTRAPTPPPGRQLTFVYKTFRSPVIGDYFSVDQFTVDFGTMMPTFLPDKTIRGTYAPDFGTAVNVTGTLGDGGKLTLQVGGTHFTGRFTRRGFAVSTNPAKLGTGERLWGQFVRVLPPALRQQQRQR